MQQIAAIREQWAHVESALASFGVAADDVATVYRFQHEGLLAALAQMPPEERAKRSMIYADDSDGEVQHDCLVPFEQLPEGFRLVMMTQIGMSVLLLSRSGYRVVRVQ